MHPPTGGGTITGMNSRTARNALWYGGLALLAIGSIGALMLKQQAEASARVDGYVAALSGTPLPGGPDYMGAFIAGGIAALGAVMLIGYLVARAQPSAPGQADPHD